MCPEEKKKKEKKKAKKREEEKPERCADATPLREATKNPKKAQRNRRPHKHRRKGFFFL